MVSSVKCWWSSCGRRKEEAFSRRSQKSVSFLFPNVSFTFPKEVGGNSLGQFPVAWGPVVKSTWELEMLIITKPWASHLDQGLLFAEASCKPAPGPHAKAPLLMKLFVCFLMIPVYVLAPVGCSTPWLCLSRPWPVGSFLLCDWLQEQAPEGARMKHHAALKRGACLCAKCSAFPFIGSHSRALM